MISSQRRPEPVLGTFPLRISAAGAIAAMGRGALLVDIRSGEGRKKIGYFGVGLAVEKADLLTVFSPSSRQRRPNLPVDQPILFFCGNEATALPFVKLLRGVGVANACNVAGGYDALRHAGLSVVQAT